MSAFVRTAGDSRSAGGRAVGIEIQGADGVHRMLRDYLDPSLSKRMQAATKAGATVFKAPLKAEAARVSKRLAASVTVRRAKKDRPATVVVFSAKKAFFRHFIIGGTRDHGPRSEQFLFFIPGWNPYFKGGPPSGATQVRAKRVRGVPANPIVERVAARVEGHAWQEIDRSLDSTETK